MDIGISIIFMKYLKKFNKIFLNDNVNGNVDEIKYSGHFIFTSNTSSLRTWVPLTSDTRVMRLFKECGVKNTVSMREYVRKY